MIWAVLSFGGVSAVLGWLLLRCKKHIGKLKVQNDALFKANEHLKRQIAIPHPSDESIIDELRNGGNF